MSVILLTIALCTPPRCMSFHLTLCNHLSNNLETNADDKERDMKNKFVLLGLILATAFSWCQSFAQPTTVISDPAGISSFEMYRTGLYYWHMEGTCGTPPQYPSIIKYVPYLYGMAPTARSVYNHCVAGFQILCPNIARDDQYFYLFDYGHLKRLSMSATEGTLPAELPTPVMSSTLYTPHLSLYNGKLYFETANYTPSEFLIRSCNLDGSGLMTELAISGSRDLKKLWVGTYIDSTPSHNSHMVSLYLTPTGDLFRQDFPDNKFVTQIGSTIRDFIIQRLPDNTDVIFLIRTYIPGKGQPAAKVDQLEICKMYPETGGATGLYTAPVNNPPTGLCSDGVNIYFIEQNLSVTNSYRIKRMPVAGSLNPDVIADLTTTRCDNIRCDASTVYFIVNDTGQQNGDVIKKIGSGVPPVQLDIEAVAVEAVQTTQSLKPENTVKLGMRKPTFVRGYAKIIQNQTTSQNYCPGARLYGYLNDTPLPQSPLNSRSNPLVSADSGPENTRYALATAFYFLPPDSWLESTGNLRLDMVVNPLNIAPETDDRSNNTVSRTFEIVQKNNPCMYFLPVRVEGLSDIDLSYPRFGSLLRRATSFWPFYDIGVYFMSDDVAEFEPLWSYGGYEYPGDQSWAQVSIFIRDQISSDPSECTRTHWVGLCHPNTPGFNGLGMIGFDSMHFRVDTGPHAYNPNDPYGGRTLAHEYGHNCGFGHINNPDTCGGVSDGPYMEEYPYDTCTIGPDDTLDYWGLDPLSWRLIPPTSVGDLMSYATDRWTSGWLWDTYIIGYYWGKGGASEISKEEEKRIMAEPQILISGFIHPKAGTGEFTRFYLLDSGMAPLEKVVKSYIRQKEAKEKGVVYTIRFLDAGDGLLVEYPLDTTDIMGDDTDARVFSSYFAFNPATKKIVLMGDVTVLAQISVSDHAPSVNLYPVEVNSASHTLTLGWEAEDEDGDPLTYLIQYSFDGGATFVTHLHDYPYFAAVLDTALLHGSTQAQIRIIASDGILSGYDTSEEFTIEKHSPRVTISGVVEGERLPFSDVRSLSGFAYDAEDGGIPGEELSWQMTGPLSRSANGGTFTLTELEPGMYNAGLSATDNDANPGSAGVNFEVLPILIPDGSPAPIVDGQVNDAVYSEGTMIRVPVGVDHFIYASLVHVGDKLYVGFSNLKYESGSSPGTMAGFTVDKNNSGDAWAQSDDYAFMVDEEGGASVSGGTGSAGMPTLTEPPLGFSAAVYRGGESWSAEMEINESLLDGWNHLARIRIGEYWLTYIGDDYGMPQLSYYDQPQTWAPAYFGSVLPALLNRGPVANAGSDRSIWIHDPINVGLDGSGSYDPDIDTISYSWTQTGGPTVTLTNAEKEAASFAVSKPAHTTVYTFQLVVDDTKESSAPDTVTVRIVPAPTAPVVSLQSLINHLLGIAILPEERRDSADFNGDKILNISDVIYKILNP